jgi:hypothetical protein
MLDKLENDFRVRKLSSENNMDKTIMFGCLAIK